MAETKTVDPRLVAEIVARYVAQNKIAADELADLIAITHRALAGLGQPAEIPKAPAPAVAISRSFGRDFVICLECGWRGQMLRRHLTVRHGLSPRDYRARWNLKDTHPLITPAYSERRSSLAKQLGLGKGRRASAPARPPRRRGRPRRTASPPAPP